MKKINFDHFAAAYILPEARSAMLPFLGESIGNPLSKHLIGDDARDAVGDARKNVAALLSAADPDEISFTSNGSEANNLAIHGTVRAYTKKGKHIIASPIEHHSIIHPLKNLAKQGYEISWLNVDKDGLVDPVQVKSLIRSDTILVTVTTASNEIGTIEPINEIGMITRECNVVFHTDAIAAAGSVDINVQELNVDLLSISSNVIYGPQGAGALYKRKVLKLYPLIEGGVQENGLRAGSHNVAGIVGFGIAAKIAKEKVVGRIKYLMPLRDKLIAGVLALPHTVLTGSKTRRLPGHTSFCLKFIEGESILLMLSFSGFAGSSGSTCSSEALKMSHVLEAIGVDTISAQGSVAFTLGIDNTEEDVNQFLTVLPPIIDKLRAMSPVTDETKMEEYNKTVRRSK
ncbi:MAG: aminotransferase class V-fold PLP-dependent enzyme [Elusimicrobiota bacterium]